MRDVIAGLRAVFDRRAKTQLLAGALGSALLAILDTIAIALVVPLIELATGPSDDSGMASEILRLLPVSDNGDKLVILTIAVVALFVIKDIGQMALSWWLTGFVFTERVRTSVKIFRFFLESPWTTVSQRSSAELLRTLDTAPMQLFNYTVNGLMNAISNGLGVLFIVIGLLIMSPLATTILIAYFAFAGAIYLIVVRPRAVRAGEEMTEASMSGYKAGLAGLGGIKEIILRRTHDHFVDRYATAAMRGASAGRTAAFLTAMPRYFLEILFIVAVAILLLVSRASDRSGLLATLAMFVAAGFRILPSASSLLGNVANIRVGISALDLVRTELSDRRGATIEASADDAEAPGTHLHSELRLEEISFRYPGAAKNAVTGVTVSIPRGSSLALVGGSGAGKTTLADLVLGLHTPTRGRVLIDGHDVRDMGVAWRASVGYVPQEVFILDASLAENVAFDQEPDSIDQRRLMRALRDAQLGDIVQGLPNGVWTELGERGSTLSGGQRQRVGIARALYRDPTVLVLDEATSALDNETEHHITETLEALRGRLTMLMIAHRLSSVRSADQVAFLRNGTLVDLGTFEQLRARVPDFARLVQLADLDPRVGGSTPPA